MKFNAIKVRLLIAKQDRAEGEFADSAGMSPQRFSTVLKREQASPRTIVKIAKELNVDPLTIVIDEKGG